MDVINYSMDGRSHLKVPNQRLDKLSRKMKLLLFNVSGKLKATLL